MNKVSTRTLGTFALIPLIAALITACGGGGGGNTPPGVALPSVTLTPATTTVVVQQDQGSSQVPVTYTTSAGTSVKLVDQYGQVVFSGSGGTVPVSVPVGATTYQLYSGNIPVGDPIILVGTCVGGTRPDTFSVCRVPPILRYTDVHVGIRNGRPGLITLDGAVWTEATNNTSYQEGVIKLFNCQISEAPQYNGEFLELCQAASDGDLHIISHNVVTNILTNFVGEVPAGYEVVKTGPSAWNIGPKWHALGYRWGTPPFPYMSGWASTASGGYIYTDFADDRILRYQDATGAQSVLYTSPDSGGFNIMITVSN